MTQKKVPCACNLSFALADDIWLSVATFLRRGIRRLDWLPFSLTYADTKDTRPSHISPFTGNASWTDMQTSCLFSPAKKIRTLFRDAWPY